MYGFLTEFFALVAFITTVAPGLEWFWKVFVTDGSSPPTLWALTMTTGLATIWIVVQYCTYRQGILRDEVNRCAKAKSVLEGQIITKRQTSAKKGAKK